MHLISCDGCGVVLDKNKLPFPPAYGDDDCALDTSEWNGDKHVATTPCPACGYKIVNDEE